MEHKFQRKSPEGREKWGIDALTPPVWVKNTFEETLIPWHFWPVAQVGKPASGGQRKRSSREL